jgi:hypothetical protein
LDDAPKGQLVEIVTATYGGGDGQLGYGEPDTVGSGPQSFAVADNGDVYVLDTFNERICVFSGGQWVRNIYTDFQIFWNMICIDGGYLYAINGYPFYAVVRTPLDDPTEWEVFEFPFEPIIMYRQFLDLRPTAKGVVAMMANWELETEQECFVTDEATKTMVPCDDLFSIGYDESREALVVVLDGTEWALTGITSGTWARGVGSDSDGNLYMKTSSDDYTAPGLWEYGLWKYDADGILAGTVLREDDQFGAVYIGNDFKVTADGTMYVMRGHSDKVSVYMAEWGG